MSYRKVFISDDRWPATKVFHWPDAVPLPEDLPEEMRDLGAILLLNPEAAEFIQPIVTHDMIAANVGRIGFVDLDGQVYWGKIVPCRVSDEALIEWVITSRDQHRFDEDPIHPDRPPDVDTPEIRGWTPHPGEEGWEDRAKTRNAIGERTETFPILTITQPSRVGRVEVAPGKVEIIPESERRVLKLLVSWRDEHYVVRLKMEVELSGDVTIDVELPVEQDPDGEWLDTTLEMYGGLLEHIGDPEREPLMFTYHDYLATEADFEQTHREISEYYDVLPKWFPKPAAAE